MTQTEALKLALEALENLEEHLPFDWAFDELQSLAGKDEYRKDLAKARSLIPVIYEALAQQDHEPVAWITPDGEGFRIRFSPPVNDVPLGWDALYTTPPQRKPLARKQIDEMANDGDFAGNVYEITRAIEAAHGITSKEQP